jgi:uncharacterized membrane protein YdjX (TVP38/TMEM64 family)
MQRSIAVLVALVLIGLVLDLSGAVDAQAVLAWGRAHAQGWALPAAIVLGQAVLFTVGQPGSIFFWPAALLYDPLVATLILTTGATAGALGAYLLARRMTHAGLERARSGRLFGILERQGDFFTLCALRVLPGMPHSALNYAAGSLVLPIGRFLAASALGLAIKSYLYASAVSQALGTVHPSALLRLEVLGPMVAISGLFLAGRFVHRP